MSIRPLLSYWLLLHYCNDYYHHYNDYPMIIIKYTVTNVHATAAAAKTGADISTTETADDSNVITRWYIVLFLLLLLLLMPQLNVDELTSHLLYGLCEKAISVKEKHRWKH